MRKLRAMTILMLVDGGDASERKSVGVVRRIREELGRVDISVSEVARRLGTTQQKLSRRMTGLTSWDVDELDEFCQAAGISYEYVATGIRTLPAGPLPPRNGASSTAGAAAGAGLLLPCLDSSQEPADVLPEIDKTAA